MAAKEILLVGYGAIGSALEEVWKTDYNITIIDPFHSKALNHPNELNSAYQPDIIVFAIKPQLLSEIISLYKNRFDNSSIIWVSIAAGVPIKFFENFLNSSPIVRGMPNLAVRFKQGMTSLYSNAGLLPLVDDLFKLTGQVLWLEKESQMDAVTAIAGSGPAYFYTMIDALADAGQDLGLSFETAMLLARQTAIGAGMILQHMSHSPTKLRQQVTSPNGTTAAALEILIDPQQGLPSLMRETTQAACHRSKILGQEQLKSILL